MKKSLRTSIWSSGSEWRCEAGQHRAAQCVGLGPQGCRSGAEFPSLLNLSAVCNDCKVFKVIPSALKMCRRISYLKKCQLFASPIYTCNFPGDLPGAGCFHTNKQGIPGSFWIQSRHMQGRREMIFPYPPLDAHSVLGTGCKECQSRWQLQGRVPVHPSVAPG